MASMKKVVVFLISLVLCGGMAPLGAHEGEESDWEQAARMAEEGRIHPLDEIVLDALRRQAGRLLEVEFERLGVRWAYEVEILDAAGTVWELYYDAETGTLLKQAPSDDEDD